MLISDPLWKEISGDILDVLSVDVSDISSWFSSSNVSSSEDPDLNFENVLFICLVDGFISLYLCSWMDALLAILAIFSIISFTAVSGSCMYCAAKVLLKHLCATLKGEKKTLDKQVNYCSNFLKMHIVLWQESPWNTPASGCHASLWHCRPIRGVLLKWAPTVCLISALYSCNDCRPRVTRLPTQHRLFASRCPASWLHWVPIRSVLEVGELFLPHLCHAYLWGELVPCH